MAELTAAAREGRLEGLRALRDVLANAIDRVRSPRDLAALSARLILVLEQIEELENRAESATPKTADAPVTPIDEIRARRAARD